MADVRVCEGLAGISRAAAEEIASAASRAQGAQSPFTLVLPGGSTPQLLFRMLAAGDAGAIPWQSVHAFWGDERCVPPDDPQSNFGLARALLLSRVPIPEDHIHRPLAERDPADAAARYAEEIANCLRLGADEWPAFDLALLGLGEDGHTASLFPDGRTLKDCRLAAAVYVPSLDAHRITLTLPVLERARRLLFLVSGKQKASILRRVLEDAGRRLAAQILARLPTTTWLVDREAAADL